MTLMHFKVVDDRFIFLKEACQWQSFGSSSYHVLVDVYMDTAVPVNRVRAQMSQGVGVEE